MFGGVKNYVQDQVMLAKLEVVEGAGKAAGSIVVIIFMALFGLFFFTFLGIAGAYYLSIYFESYIYGFLAMAGIFLLLLILFAIFKKAIQNLVANIIVAATMGGKKVKKK
ncbi:phage holin family protein [Ornithobacterium rhinotracheale]